MYSNGSSSSVVPSTLWHKPASRIAESRLLGGSGVLNRDPNPGPPLQLVLSNLTMSNEQPIVLTIAGTDPSGGAGIQADLKTFAAHGCFGTSAVTALVAQNTTGVQAIHAPPPEFVAHQIRCVLEDTVVAAAKTGMLHDAATLRAVVATLRAHYLNAETVPPLVVDPVSVSTSGHTLLQADALDALRTELLSLATVVTPNVPEAQLLLGDGAEITTVQGMLVAAAALSALGPRAVLLKGGHLQCTAHDVQSLPVQHVSVVWLDAAVIGPEPVAVLAHNHGAPGPSQSVVIDVLHEVQGRTTVFVRARLDTTSTHGTGCTLSAALACELARGKSVREAARAAILYTHRAIETAPGIGRGHGPLNHLHGLVARQVPRKSGTNPFPFVSALIAASGHEWAEYVKHPFVVQLGKGTLPVENFKHFITQDWHYLEYYARANGLLIAKSSTFPAMAAAATTVQAIVSETATHEALCAAFGISQDELRASEESAATTSYGGYLLDVALAGDAGALLVALGSCLVGYGEVGLWLVRQAREHAAAGYTVEGNPFQRWIEDYSGEAYQHAVTVGLEALENLAEESMPSVARMHEYAYIWRKCTQLEKKFWDMALDLQ